MDRQKVKQVLQSISRKNPHRSKFVEFFYELKRLDTAVKDHRKEQVKKTFKLLDGGLNG